jgi:hypothetical protein
MRVKLTILAGVMASLLPAVPAQADGARWTSCIGGRYSVNCITQWRKWTPEEPKPPTEQEIAESRERDRQWQERCARVIVQDNLGVPRYTYAAPGCEYGRIQ